MGRRDLRLWTASKCIGGHGVRRCLSSVIFLREHTRFFFLMNIKRFDYHHPAYLGIDDVVDWMDRPSGDQQHINYESDL